MKYTKLLAKSALAFAFLGLTQAFAQTATFDPATSILRVPAIQVGNTVYTNLVYRADSGAILAIGPAQAVAQTSVSDSCSAANITLAKFNAITLGMSVDQVNALMGCRFDSLFTVRSTLATQYTWQADNTSRVVTVYFDPSGTTVTSASPAVVFYKFSSGI